MELSPIILFVYNRPKHTQETIIALKNNKLASESELFIYSDAAKHAEDEAMVDDVRVLVSNISGFRKVTVIEQVKNKGLANSIVDGVTNIIERYGQVIVLEDDLVISPYFLQFMNGALNFYRENKKVWHISGWNYPIDKEGLQDVFLWRLMNCWGWATWSDRWSYFEKNPEQLMNEFSTECIRQFNLDNIEDFWGQVISNNNGVINTWAIFWYATIFKYEGLCLNPTQTLVDNIGLDGSGVHCDATNIYEVQLSNHHKIDFKCEVVEDKLALSRVQSFYRKLKKPFFIRAINKIARIVTKWKFL